MDDLELRAAIYRWILNTGSVPLRADLATLVDSSGSLDEQLRRLHDGHMIVLDDRPDRLGEIRMALPFSAEPTGFHAESQRGSWFANCAWDALAIAAALHEDTHITATWTDTAEPLQFSIVGGEIVGGEIVGGEIVGGEIDSATQPPVADGFVHFAIPARHWWDDIVET